MHTAELVKIVDRVVLKAFPYSSYYVINGCREIAGWDQQRAAEHIEAIYDTTLAVLRHAELDGITTDEAARRVAKGRLNYRTKD
jgi:hypothetical protein